MIKFFTYGIFLDPKTRKGWGIWSTPKYATVKGYSTRGGKIVYAHEAPEETLTGLVVEIDKDTLSAVDALEYGSGYKRITVTTTDGEDVQMYVEDIERMHSYARN